MDSYKRSILIKLWWKGYTVQRMSDYHCIMAPVALVRAELQQLMDAGVFGAPTGIL